MKDLNVGGQVTLNGRTYLPGKYKVVGNNLDAGPGEVHEREAVALLANHPVLVQEHKPKPAPKKTTTTKKSTTKKAESKATGETKS